MQKIKIDKKKLLARLRENKTQHEKVFIETFNNYKIKARENLETFYKESPAKIAAGENVYYPSLTIPTSYSKEYETAIEILEFSVDKTVELTHEEFKQYVRDEWSWHKVFTQVTGFYNSSKINKKVSTTFKIN